MIAYIYCRIPIRLQLQYHHLPPKTRFHYPYSLLLDRNEIRKTMNLQNKSPETNKQPNIEQQFFHIMIGRRPSFITPIFSHSSSEFDQRTHKQKSGKVHSKLTVLLKRLCTRQLHNGARHTHPLHINQQRRCLLWAEEVSARQSPKNEHALQILQLHDLAFRKWNRSSLQKEANSVQQTPLKGEMTFDQQRIVARRLKHMLKYRLGNQSTICVVE